MTPTIVWFVVALAAALLYVDRDLDTPRRLVDKAPGDTAPSAAGPTFVQKEQERQLQARPEEIAERVALPPPAPTPPGADRSLVAPGAGIEDVCLDGPNDACRRWAMDGFHDALARSGERPARISLWGDSVTAEGFIATGMRTRLAATYGDGGAGFVFMTPPSRWYHNDVVRQSDVGHWTINSIIHNGVPDKLYGYGGVSFTGTQGESVTFRTARHRDDLGGKVSRFELYYLASPRGGTAEIVVDGVLAATVDTRADATRSGFAAVTMEDGPHKIEVKVTAGTVRAFGATMERDAGVVVDSLGVVSNTANNLADIRGAHWREQLAHRDADLMMVLLGANESAWVNDKVEMKDFRADWDTVLGRLRAANPEASCLVLGTLDAGGWVDGKYRSRKSIPRMIEVERAAARAAGCAFWDSRAYMGGDLSARTWKKDGLMAEDHEHLTGKGGEVLGSAIVAALEAGYASGSR